MWPPWGARRRLQVTVDDDAARATRALALGLGAAASAAIGASMWLSPAPWTLALDAGTSFLGQTVPAFRMWAAGTVPAWSDLLWGGFPLLAEPTTAALYPPHAIAFVATLGAPLRFFDVALALHVGLLVAGSAMLARTLGAGVVATTMAGLFALLSPALHAHALANFAAFAALAWLPWILCAVEALGRPTTRRFSGASWLAWTGLVAQVFVGMPEHALYSGTIAAVWLALRGRALPLRERLVRIALVGGGALSLAAPQTLATLAYLPATTRAAAAPSAELASLWIASPLGMLLPAAGARVPAFAGIATLLLACVAIVRRRAGAGLLGAIATTTFLLSLGPTIGLYWWLHRLPLFDQFRAPFKLAAFAELCLAWTAAFGVDALLGSHRPWRLAGLALAVLAVTEHVAFLQHDERPILTELRRGAPPPDVLDQLGDLEALRTHDPTAVPPLVLDVTPPLGGGYVHSLGALVGMSALHAGDVSLLPAAHAKLLYRAASRGLATMLGAQFAMVPARRCENLSRRWRWPVAETRRDFCLLANPNARPRYELVTSIRSVDSFDDMVRAVHEATPTTPVPIVAPPDVVADIHRGRVSILERTRRQTWLLTSSPTRAMLLVRQSFVPGWHVLVDGSPTVVYPAAGPYFVVPLPPGSHRVTLDYTPPGFALGIAIAIAWLVVARVCTRRASGRG